MALNYIWIASMKPLSGSGAHGLMIDVIKTNGADSINFHL